MLAGTGDVLEFCDPEGVDTSEPRASEYDSATPAAEPAARFRKAAVSTTDESSMTMSESPSSASSILPFFSEGLWETAALAVGMDCRT